MHRVLTVPVLSLLLVAGGCVSADPFGEAFGEPIALWGVAGGRVLNTIGSTSIPSVEVYLSEGFELCSDFGDGERTGGTGVWVTLVQREGGTFVAPTDGTFTVGDASSGVDGRFVSGTVFKRDPTSCAPVEAGTLEFGSGTIEVTDMAAFAEGARPLDLSFAVTLGDGGRLDASTSVRACAPAIQSLLDEAKGGSIACAP